MLKTHAKEYKIAILKLWRFRLVARTHASHAWNTGSIPVGATLVRTFKVLIFFAYVELSRFLKREYGFSREGVMIDKPCLSRPARRELHPRFVRPIAASLVD